MQMVLVILISVYSGIIYADNNYSIMFESISIEPLLGTWRLSKDFNEGERGKCSTFFKFVDSEKGSIIKWNNGSKIISEKYVNSVPISLSRTFIVGMGKITRMEQITLQDTGYGLQLQFAIDYDHPFYNCAAVNTISLDTELDVFHLTSHGSCDTYSWIESLFTDDDRDCLYKREH